LLLVRADAALLTAQRDPAAAAPMRDAERWNALAENYLDADQDRRALLMQRAWLAKLAGGTERAEQLRAGALTLPARSAMDLFTDINAELRQGRFRAALKHLDDALRL